MSQTDHQQLPAGARIGVHEIKGVVDSDEYAITYRGWNHHLQGAVTLKEYFPRHLAARHGAGEQVVPQSANVRADYQAGVERFFQEGERLMLVEHPSLPGVLNVLPANGTAYLVMEPVSGVPLETLCGRVGTRPSGEELQDMARRLLGALGLMHQRDQLHGAINPSNILVRGNGQPVLVRCSGARIAMAALSGTLAEVVNADYAAPEQQDPNGRCGPWTDLYALGATLRRCVAERAPAPPAADGVAGSGQPGYRPKPPDAVPVEASQYPPQLLAALDWMTRSRPQERAQSAQDVLSLLETQPQDAPAKARTPKGSPTPARGAEAPGRRRAVLSGGLALGLVAALVVGRLWYLQVMPPSGKTPIGSVETPLAPSEVAQAVFESHGVQAPAAGRDETLPAPQDAPGMVTEPREQTSVEGGSPSGTPARAQIAPPAAVAAAAGAGEGEREERAAKLSSQEPGATVAPSGLQEQPLIAGSPDPAATVPPALADNDSKGAAQAVPASRPRDLSERDSAGQGAWAQAPEDTPASGASAGHGSAVSRPLTPAGPGPADTRAEPMDRAPAASSGASAAAETQPASSGAISEDLAATQPDADLASPRTGAGPKITEAPAGDLQAPREGVVAAAGKLPASDSRPEPSVSAETIQSHLDAAAEDLGAFRLTTPPADNAWEHYQAVLALVPEHPAALAGLDQIGERYAWLIERAIDQRRFRRARVYLQRAERILPGDPRLEQLRLRLEEAE